MNDDLTATNEAASLAVGPTGQAIAEALLAHAKTMVPDTVAASERARFATMACAIAAGIGGANQLLDHDKDMIESCVKSANALFQELVALSDPTDDIMPVLSVLSCACMAFINRARRNLASLTTGGSNGRPN